ncbi:MAG: DUF4331 domain-containing protein [Panacagrimonas sp.]
MSMLKSSLLIGSAAAGALLGFAAQASSHREAPFIASIPKVDGTDFYMFRSYENGRNGFVTLIANYQPLQDSYGGPNYFTMDPDALYEIHVDNNGDAIEDLTFQFRFRNQYGQANIPGAVTNGTVNGAVAATGAPTPTASPVQVPLANVGGGTGAATGALNVVETYTVSLVRGDRRSSAGTQLTNPNGGGANFTKPVDNIGEKSIPNYSGYANQFIYNNVAIPGCAATGAKLFVGQRREGFVVNLGQVFDQINLNPLEPSRSSGSNIIDDKNVTSLALEVPVACLTNGTEPVIGAWTTASVRQARLINPSPVGPVANASGRGPAQQGGAWAQVSRLGHPLVNEVVIGITDKDRFNASEPKDDVATFANYVLTPSLPILVNVLFGVAPPPTPRIDLLNVFVTGIRTPVNGVATSFTHPQGVNLTSFAGAGEMLRLNTAFPTAANAVAPTPSSDLGFLACDLNGFPNGRRPIDDVVDIALTGAEGALLGFNGLQTCNVAGASPAVVNAGAVVNDGALPVASDYLTAFPYLNTPIPGGVDP